MMEIITANELVSGATVYLDASNQWQTDIDVARLFGSDDGAARDAIVEAAQSKGAMVSVEIEKVQVVDGKVIAQRLRERIRANGPTAPYGTERQHLTGDSNVSL